MTNRPTYETLTKKYNDWASLEAQNNHEVWSCALEMQHEEITDTQRAWLESFCDDWDEMSNKG
jgi:hypothetical protein